ncbi:anti-sigma-I factor RsgI-like [Drosophila kikkawai]|uniref:Anti-sigma-I factor RsgI-like n=1 Tax=Drosophila kikkawai TaxID=30033 RepID=A0ABM4GGN6_DROKI
MQSEVQTLENLRVEIAKAQEKRENLNRQIGNEDTENEGGENAQLRNRDGNSSSENLEQSVRSLENTQRGDDRDGEIGGGRSSGRSSGSGDDRDGEIGGGRRGGSGEDRDGDIGGGSGEGRDGDRNGDGMLLQGGLRSLLMSCWNNSSWRLEASSPSLHYGASSKHVVGLQMSSLPHTLARNADWLEMSKWTRRNYWMGSWRAFQY